MVETFGMTGMLVLAFLVLVAIYILMQMLGYPSNGEGDGEEGEAEGEDEPVARSSEKPAETSDEAFLDSYMGPILEDALDALELAVESAGSGLLFYEKGAWEEAGDEFHSAIAKLDEASGLFQEIPGLIDDPDLKPAAQAKARVDECLRLRALAIRMEEACDAMAHGNAEEAQKSVVAKNDLRRMVTAFSR